MWKGRSDLPSQIQRGGSSKLDSLHQGMPCSYLDLLWAVIQKISKIPRFSYRKTYAVSVASVSAHEDSFIQSVLFRYSLSNGIYREPLHTIPLNIVWFQDFLCCFHDLFLGRCLPWIEVGI